VNRRRSIVLSTMALVLGVALTVIANLPSITTPTAVPPQAAVGASETRLISGSIEGLATFASYDELAEFLKNLTALQRVEYHDAGYLAYYLPASTALPRAYTLQELREAAAIAAPAPTTEAAGEFSTTNVQVEGVDELDIVKTNGQVIVVASGRSVYVVDPVGRKVVSRIEVEGGWVRGVFLYESRLAVVAESPIVVPMRLDVESRCKCLIVPAGSPNTTVLVYDIELPNSPRLELSTSITGHTIASRLVGSYMYLIAWQPISEPTLPLLDGSPIGPQSIAVADTQPNSYTNILAVDLKTGERRVQSFLTGAGSRIYMTPDRLYIAVQKYVSQRDVYGMGMTALLDYLPRALAESVQNDLSSGAYWRAVERVSEYFGGLDQKEVERIIGEVNSRLKRERLEEETTFYVFEVEGLEARLKGSFAVPGVLLEQFSMEEYEGNFLVATTRTMSVVKLEFVRPVVIAGGDAKEGRTVEVEIIACRNGRCTSETLRVTVAQERETGFKPWLGVFVVPRETSNNLFVIRLDDLKIVGELRDLAPGERIYAARLLKNVFYLVTFRETDPLFAIDVSNPERPEVLGFLKVPGFSEYLHPLDDNTLIGVGRENNALKISMFNVTDPRAMSELASIKIPGGYSPALFDHHALTVDYRLKRVYIPAVVYQPGGYVSGVLVVEYDESSLQHKALLHHDGASRTLYIGSEVYTVSSNLIKVFSATDYRQLAEIELNES